MRERVESLDGDAARYDAIIRYFVEQVCDTQTQLLQIEFKLFALRHPEMLAELAEKHLDASTSINRQELSDLFPEKNESMAETRCHTLAIKALLEGIGLNARFSPAALDELSIQEIVPQFVAQILRRA